MEAIELKTPQDSDYVRVNPRGTGYAPWNAPRDRSAVMSN